MNREDEVWALVPRARGDDAVFMAGLVEIARRDVQEALDALCGAAEIGRRALAYEELTALGRRLATAAALVAGEEEGDA